MSVSQTVTITNEKGLHARPSALVSKTASRFQSNISIAKTGKVANAKSIIEVLTLCASKGTVLTITAEGADEKAALTCIVALVQSAFTEFE